MTTGLGFNDDAQIRGATDDTLIGNTLDYLKVDPRISPFLSAWSNKLRYDDMNASNGGVARATSIATSATWTTVYSYSGSGFLAGFLLNLDTFTGWEIRLIIDSSNTVFTFVSEDLTNDGIYDVDDIPNSNLDFIGITVGSHDVFTWHPPIGAPLKYSTGVQIQVRRPTAGAKRFDAGLVILSKET